MCSPFSFGGFLSTKHWKHNLAYLGYASMPPSFYFYLKWRASFGNAIQLISFCRFRGARASADPMLVEVPMWSVRGNGKVKRMPTAGNLGLGVSRLSFTRT